LHVECERDCFSSGNKVFQIETSIEALVVATKEGCVADICIRLFDELDKIKAVQLDLLQYPPMSPTMKDGALAIPNIDGDKATHLWSEILDHPPCPPIATTISWSAVLICFYP
jgi:hypothetical protein